MKGPCLANTARPPCKYVTRYIKRPPLQGRPALYLALDRGKVVLTRRMRGFHIFCPTYGAWKHRYAGLDTSGHTRTGRRKYRTGPIVTSTPWRAQRSGGQLVADANGQVPRIEAAIAQIQPAFDGNRGRFATRLHSRLEALVHASKLLNNVPHWGYTMVISQATASVAFILLLIAARGQIRSSDHLDQRRNCSRRCG